MKESQLHREQKKQHIPLAQKIRHIFHHEKKEENGVVPVASNASAPDSKRSDGVPLKGVKTSSKKAVSQPVSFRPIERMLIGVWDAMKPEAQGKSIMKAMDVLSKPVASSPEESSVVASRRLAVEKTVGWTAVALEAGAVALLAAYGITRPKKEPPWLRGISGRTYQNKSEHPNPLIRQLDRLLRVEPLIAGDGVHLRTVIGQGLNNTKIAVTAIEFEKVSLRDVRIDIVDMARQLVGILVVAQTGKAFACERVEMPLTAMDMANWPRIIPSDSLRTEDVGADTRMFPAGMDEIAGVAMLLEKLIKDRGATRSRQELFKKMWQQGAE